jgi:hypothetical protein
MRDQIIERNFVAGAQRERKLAVEIGGLYALDLNPQGGPGVARDPRLSLVSETVPER